jgi:glycosyltransferase involved in cell wall biosynthesis
MKKGKVLYASYDGILEPLGHSQVLNYLLLLQKEYDIILVSFEKTSDWKSIDKRKELDGIIKNSGIFWYPLQYTKNPPYLSTFFDTLKLLFLSSLLYIKFKPKIFHARSYVTAFVGNILRFFTDVKFVFDMRGFWVDERVDGGIWKKNSIPYKVSKYYERKFFKNCDHLVSLTEAGISEMRHLNLIDFSTKKYSVIPTCVDLDRFFPRKRDFNNPFVLGYVGSVGTWYVFDAVIFCFSELIRIMPNAKILIVNRDQHKFIEDKLLSAGILRSSFELISANFHEIPALIHRMSAGIFFIKQVFSKLGSSPTRLAEFLACGIPCLTNEGIGDVSEILGYKKCGVIVNSFDESKLRYGLFELIELTKDVNVLENCVSSASLYFSLEKGVEEYKRIYESLI